MTSPPTKRSACTLFEKLTVTVPGAFAPRWMFSSAVATEGSPTTARLDHPIPRTTRSDGVPAVVLRRCAESRFRGALVGHHAIALVTGIRAPLRGPRGRAPRDPVGESEGAQVFAAAIAVKTHTPCASLVLHRPIPGA